LPHNEADVYDELISRLEDLKGEDDDGVGIKQVYDGFRKLESIPDTAYPFIMLEPDGMETMQDAVDHVSANYALEELTITIWVGFLTSEKGTGATGSDNIGRGMLQWGRVVRNKITDAPKHLNNKCAKIRFKAIRFMRTAQEVIEQSHAKIVEIEVGLLCVYSN